MKPSAQLEDIIRPVQPELAAVERTLHEGTRSFAPLISEIGDYTFEGGGKRVRPLLVLLCAQMCGYRGPRAVQIGAAAEFLHTATLVHDDVVDGAEMRRGRLSVNAEFGTKLAILIGDYLLATSSSMLIEDGNNDILSAYSDTIRKMAEGEVMQLTRSFDPDIPESLYLEVIGRKTATLLATAAESGAILADVTRPERRAVREFGWQLGLAFQLVDDALDYAVTGQELGKAPLTDLAEGKVTLPLLVALKNCSVGERESIQTDLKNFANSQADDAASLQRVAQAVERYNGIAITLERARQCSQEACLQIESFIDSNAKRSLLDLAAFVVQRRS